MQGQPACHSMGLLLHFTATFQSVQIQLSVYDFINGTVINVCVRNIDLYNAYRFPVFIVNF
jgi:hypothetical protein